MNRVFHVILALGFAVVFPALGAAQSVDPLPSWNDGDVKLAITQFVTSVTTKGSPDHHSVDLPKRMQHIYLPLLIGELVDADGSAT